MGHKSRSKEPVEVRPQRCTWKTAAAYDRHVEALADRERREQQDSKALVKIKLRGKRFEVRVGTPIRKKNEEPQVEAKQEQ